MQSNDFNQMISNLFFHFITKNNTEAKNYAKKCGVSSEDINKLKSNTFDDLDFLNNESIVGVYFDSSKFNFAQQKISRQKRHEEMIDLAIFLGASRANLMDLAKLSSRDFTEKRKELLDTGDNKTKPSALSQKEVENLNKTYREIVNNITKSERLEKIVRLSQKSNVSISRIMAFYRYNNDLFSE